MDYTEGIPSVRLYRLWSAITTVGGALERRVWTESLMNKIYPNLYTMLIGPPGSGKSQAIEKATDLWSLCSKDIYISPKSMTKAALMDALEQSLRAIPMLGGKELLEYHSMMIGVDEFGVLCTAHDLEFLSVLNTLFDNPSSYHETRRFNKTSTVITAPQLSILAGTQPGYMSSMLPEIAWSMGFTSRLIMIYSGKKVRPDIFSIPQPREKARQDLATRLTAITKMLGPMQWTPDATDAFKTWFRADMPPTPTHTKLNHYNERRGLHTFKLAMIASASRAPDHKVRLEDFERGRGWLLEAETVMPDVFREMVAQNDSAVIQDLHYFLWRIWAQKQKPIHESIVWEFLSTRIPSDKITRLLEAAERSNVIKRAAGTDAWVPIARTTVGVE